MSDKSFSNRIASELAEIIGELKPVRSFPNDKPFSPRDRVDIARLDTNADGELDASELFQAGNMGRTLDRLEQLREEYLKPGNREIIARNRPEVAEYLDNMLVPEGWAKAQAAQQSLTQQREAEEKTMREARELAAEQRKRGISTEDTPDKQPIPKKRAENAEEPEEAKDDGTRASGIRSMRTMRSGESPAPASPPVPGYNPFSQMIMAGGDNERPAAPDPMLNNPLGLPNSAMASVRRIREGMINGGALVQAMDTNGDKTLSREEIGAVKNETWQQLKKSLDVITRDGKVDAQELSGAIENLMPGFKVEDGAALLKAANTPAAPKQTENKSR